MPERVAFVMTRFNNTRLHNEIFEAIWKSLADVGFTAVRADGQAFHDNLFENVLTYIHGCRFGIAVFERLSADDFNPNVSLEVGYMLALRKPVCLLKDQTLRALPTDLVGRIYRTFDPQSPRESIPSQLQSWMTEKRLLPIPQQD
jgi:nucleoside 2-deoxyribosyltransferase